MKEEYLSLLDRIKADSIILENNVGKCLDSEITDILIENVRKSSLSEDLVSSVNEYKELLYELYEGKVISWIPDLEKIRTFREELNFYRGYANAHLK